MNTSSLRQQFFRYSVVGVLNFIISTLVLNVLARLTHIYHGPWLFVFYAIAFTVTVTNSYLCNRSWTFKAKKGSVIQYPLFYMLTLIGFGLNSTIIFVITTFIPVPPEFSAPVWLNMANVVTAGVSILWNFMAYSQLVFRSTSTEVSN